MTDQTTRETTTTAMPTAVSCNIAGCAGNCGICQPTPTGEGSGREVDAEFGPDEKRVTARGFSDFARIIDSYGGVVEVRESSSAAGPHVWVYLEGTCHVTGPIEQRLADEERGPGFMGAHLDPDQAKRLRDALDAFLSPTAARGVTGLEARLAEIEARANAASAEPWEAGLGWVYFAGTYPTPTTPLRAIANQTTMEDAAFIAHAREDVPWLIEQVRTLLSAAEQQNNPRGREAPTDELEVVVPGEWEELEDRVRLAIYGDDRMTAKERDAATEALSQLHAAAVQAETMRAARDEACAALGEANDALRTIAGLPADADAEDARTEALRAAVQGAEDREPARYDQTPDGCWVACIAGLTDIPHEELAALVPRLPDGSYDGSMGTEYHNAINALLRQRGWRLERLGPDAPKGYAIGSGTSPRGAFHAVIVKDGRLWHDPHPSRAGVAALESFEAIVPLADSPAMRDPASVQQWIDAARQPRPEGQETNS